MFARSKNNPILKPDSKNSWESRKVYNAGVIFEDGEYHLFYRAMGDDNISRIGHAVSTDGENFIKKKKPLLCPNTEFEEKGMEDSRIIKLEGKYYLTYTGYDGKTARLKLAISKDLKNWQKIGVLFPEWNFFENKNFIVDWDKALDDPEEDINWSKAGGIFPEKIGNKYYMLFGDRNIWIATSTDKINWKADNQPFITPQPKKGFDSIHVEMGPPPIKTNKGWLVLYHGINNKIEYKLGFILLDLKNPYKVLYRTKKAIFEPKEAYEINGLVDVGNAEQQPKVIFCCGTVLRGDKLEIFYGASDSVICKATASLEKILKNTT